MKRGRKIQTFTVFIAVDHDGDEALVQIDGAPMLVAHDRERLLRLRELRHRVAIERVEHIEEVVFVRARNDRYHFMYDGPEDRPWEQGTNYDWLDLTSPCVDAACHRGHVYLNYAANRAADSARARRMSKALRRLRP